MRVIGPCNKSERRICAEKGKDVSIIKGIKRKDAQVHQRTIEKRIY